MGINHSTPYLRLDAVNKTHTYMVYCEQYYPCIKVRLTSRMRFFSPLASFVSETFLIDCDMLFDLCLKFSSSPPLVKSIRAAEIMNRKHCVPPPSMQNSWKKAKSSIFHVSKQM